MESKENKSRNDGILAKAKLISAAMNNEKPKRSLSAYNFFVKEERANILANIDSDSTLKSSKGEIASNRSRPMKKRRMIDTAKKNLEQTGNGISFEQIGKMIGERWQVVKANPEVFKKYENLAFEDHKRYDREMNEYNERKKKILFPLLHSKSQTSQPSRSKVTIASNEIARNFHKSHRSQPIGSYRKINREAMSFSDRDTAIANNLSHLRPVSNFQPLLPNRVQFPQSQLAHYRNPDLLEKQIPFSAMHNVGDPQAIALDVALRQQEEQIALLRQLSKPSAGFDSLYQDYIQFEQAKAALTGPEQELNFQQRPHIAARFAPNVESLTAQQYPLLPVELNAFSQRNQLSMLSSQLDPSSSNLDLSRAWASILSQRSDESDLSMLPFQGSQGKPQSNPDNTAALLMAYSDMTRRNPRS